MIAEAEYHTPTDVESACRLLADNDEAVVVAGGQSLSLLTKEGILSPDVLVDIKGIEQLEGIEVDDGALRIGATTTHRDIETSEAVAETLPALSESASRIADVQIRNAGTIGGVAAYADPTADYPPVFLVSDATIVAETADGRTEYDAEDFFVGYYRSALDEQALVTEVRLPALDGDEAIAYERLAFRENDRAIVNAAAYLAAEDGTCTDARVAVGATTNRPLLLEGTAAELVGSDLAAPTLESAAEAARAETPVASDPSIDEGYREEMVENLVGNALETAEERLGGIR